MKDVWKQWEGQVADGRYPLRQFLGGSERGPVFLTESSRPERHKCAIKFFVADPEIADAQMARWEQATKLAHPHLQRLLHTGRCELGGARMLYAVMECADEDLSQVVPVRPLTAADAGGAGIFARQGARTRAHQAVEHYGGGRALEDFE